MFHIRPFTAGRVDRKPAARSNLTALLLAITLATPAFADSFFWDANGATAGTGGTGNWLDPSLWRQSTITGNLVNWPNTDPNSDTAVFTGTGTVTVNAPVFTNGIDFEENIYTITGSSYITLSGSNPTITLNLTGTPSSTEVTLAVPFTGSNGVTITGNSTGQTLRFIVFANNNAASPNNFTGNITVTNTGVMRLGGGFFEQIPDTADLNLSGVMDFITANGVSNGKTERIHDLLVNGTAANFSLGNGSTFTVHNLTATGATGSGVALNGNAATNTTFTTALPSTLVIEGDMNLAGSLMKIVTTSSAGTIPGGIVNLMGNFSASGTSQVTFAAASAATVATHAFNFAGPAVAAPHTHIINVAGGSTLTFTSVNATQTLNITSTNGPATINKTGAGEWVISSQAVETTFTGTTDVQQGILTIGANDRLATASNLTVSGGTLNMQTFNQTVAAVKLTGGNINGSSNATLTSTAAFDAQQGTISAKLGGSNGLNKTGPGTVILNGINTYTGPTSISNGLLVVNGSLAAGSPVSLSNGGALGGTGTVNGAITLATGGKIAPGSSPGTLNTASQTWQPGGTYAWEIASASTTFGNGKGTLAGYDFLNIAGTLDLTALDASHTITIDPIGMDSSTFTPGGAISNWDNTKTYTWVLASASGGITGFSPGNFTLLNDFGAANPLGNGTFSITVGPSAAGGTANDLLLIFSVPEPSSMLLLATGALLLARRRSRGISCGR